MNDELNLTFDTTEPIELYVENGRGSVTVHATDRLATTVQIRSDRAEEFDVRDLGDRIAVIAPPRTAGFLGRHTEARILIEVPIASSLKAKLGSSDLAAHGRLNDIRVESGSGDVTLEIVEGDAVIQTGSGDVLAQHLLGEAHLKSGSGDIRLGRAESGAIVTTGSGDVQVEQAPDGVAIKTGSGDAHVRTLVGEAVFTTGSGDLAVDEVAGGRITAKTASGDVRIGVVPGTPVWTDVRTASGHLTSHLPSTGEPSPDQPYLEVRATTASGDVTLAPC